MSEYVVEVVGIEGVDRVEPLWHAMVEHHGAVTGLSVRDLDETWRRRRAEYVEWLRGGAGTILVAVPAAGGDPVGYAVLRIHAGGATFDLGERVGELESLAVAADARGSGVGGMLIAAGRAHMRAAGVEHWMVAVMEANASAQRLYEREGFQPFLRQMVSRV